MLIFNPAAATLTKHTGKQDAVMDTHPKTKDILEEASA